MKYRTIIGVSAFLCSALSLSPVKGQSTVSNESKNTVTKDSILNLVADFSPFMIKYQELVEETLVWRANAITFFEYLKKEEKTYSSATLMLLHREGTKRGLEIRQKHYLLINLFKPLMADNINLTVDISKPSGKTSNHNTLGRKKYTININPLETQGRTLANYIKVGFSSALLLYDNYLLAISQYEKFSKTRRILDSDNTEIRDSLSKISSNFRSIENMQKFKKASAFLDKYAKFEKELPLTSEEQYLNQLIAGSYMYSLQKKIDLIELLKYSFSKLLQKLSDTLNLSQDKAADQVSEAFGNTAGLVQVRRGKLKGLPAADLEKIKNVLQPLDILLEKTPFRLTDKFIPGHWGHVAVWVGSEEDLRTAGVWDHPLVLPHQAEIIQGKKIIEALRSGVAINSLEHFMDIDDFSAIRMINLSSEKKATYLQNAFKQIGKEYDFNFDVETDRKIVCSELAYVTFADLKWPTSKQLGRSTISPDNVASKAIGPDKQFNSIILYHDGQEILNNVDYNFEMLFRAKYDDLKL